MKNKNKIDLIFVGLLLIALVPFYLWESLRLQIGGAIFIVLGLKQILFDSNLIFVLRSRNEKLFNYSFFIGFLLFALGMLSFSVQILLPSNVSSFLLIFLTCVLCIAILISFLWSKFRIAEKVLSILTFVAPILLYASLVMEALITTIKEQGMTSASFYVQTIIFVAIVLWYLSIFIRAFFESVIFVTGYKQDIMLKTSFHIHVAITLLLLIGGFFYLKHASTEPLKDFLILLGVILSIWLAISSGK